MSRTPTPAEQAKADSRERLEAGMWDIFRLNGVRTEIQVQLMADLLDAIDDHAGRLGDIWVEETAAEARLQAARAEHSPATLPRRRKGRQPCCGAPPPDHYAACTATAERTGRTP